MVKLIKLFAITTLMVLASCQKDSILQPTQTEAVKLSYGSTMELSVSNRQNGVHSFFMDKGDDFQSAKNLYSLFDGTEYAAPNFYYNGKIVRYWDGNSFR
jgi:hypothetical protein